MQSKLEAVSLREGARAHGRTRASSWKTGFTLIELLVVIAIMAILAGLVFGAMRGMGDSSKRKKAKTLISTIELALEMYRQEFGSFPVSVADPEDNAEQGARILYQALSGDGNDQLLGDQPSQGELGSSHRALMGLLDPRRNAFKMVSTGPGGSYYLIDPWGEPFHYLCFQLPVDRQANQHNPASYDLYTHGASASDEEPGEGEEDDDPEKKWVTNWD